MRTWKRVLAFVLALVMVLSLASMPTFAEGETTETDPVRTPSDVVTAEDGHNHFNGLELYKRYDEENSKVILEAYATGTKSTTTSKTAADIVLVLDVSGSMGSSYITTYTYTETYSVSTNSRSTYYYMSNGSYSQAYYCSTCSGWYTQQHSDGFLGLGESHNGAKLTPKTSATDTDATHTQFYTRNSSSKSYMETLKSAVCDFIDSINASSPESNIALVKFANEKKDTIGNDFDGYYSGENRTQTVFDLTAASDENVETMKTTVNNLKAAGYTSAHLGMQLAQGILENSPNPDRQKIVIMFTDGEPNGVTVNGSTTTSGFQAAAAKEAIAASNNIKAIKDSKGNAALVYTIGCFSSETNDLNNYMNRVSSNYLDATTLTDGTKTDDSYYKLVSEELDLSSIFQEISQTMGGSTMTLTETTVLKDVISGAFDLPEGADESKITVYSVPCTGTAADGTHTWGASNNDGDQYTVTISDDRKSIEVTGFDYSAKWVDQYGVEGSTSHGSKLVVEIPIVDNETLHGDQPTNAATSGIYPADSNSYFPFPVPETYLPYFTIKHIQSGAENTELTRSYRLKNQTVDLTELVPEGYLYGGTFTDESGYTTVWPFNAGENGMGFTADTDQAVYCIWEVKDTYLRPSNYNAWQHIGGLKTVTRVYPLTGVDRMLYQQVGFTVTVDDETVDVPSGHDHFGQSLNNVTDAKLYQTVEAWKSGAYYQGIYMKNGLMNATGYYQAIPADIDDGYIAGVAEYWEQLDYATLTYEPYWVTMDNVKVYGVRVRTSEFQENAEQPKNTTTEQLTRCENLNAAETALMSLCFEPVFLMDDAQISYITVTVNDNGTQSQLYLQPGDIRDQLSYAAPEGKLFAGWFTDEACTTAAQLTDVQEDITVYAKYVSDDYLTLKYNRNGIFRVTGVSLVSAIDSDSYAETGFIINGETYVVDSYATRYRLFYTAGALFGGDVARRAPLMTLDYALSGSGTLEVVPYWVTLDGTTVTGAARTLTYTSRTIRG